MAASRMIPPGSVVGILGGGQLGRMTALAAAPLGYRCHIYAPDADPPASQVSALTMRGGWDDRSALARFAAACDVITYEFENIPETTVAYVETLKPVRPSSRVIGIAQHRLREKDFCNAAGVPTTAYAAVSSRGELDTAIASVGLPAILKTLTDGYDGKGQARLAAGADAAARDAAWAALGGRPAILEKMVAFDSELSVIVARGLDGTSRAFTPGTNVHKNGILDTTTVPAKASAAVLAEAERLGIRLAEALDLRGLVALELFLTSDGRLLANEMAPRPHNSGHWTQDACMTSQFEQVVRAICGLPLGSVERRCDASMLNLIGGDVDQWVDFIDQSDAKLHLYGKLEARPGRKMGHVNRLLK